LLYDVRTKPTYFRAEDLAVNGLNAVQAAAGLHLLAALGLVRQVQVEGRLLWRRVDPVPEAARKPAVLA
jgi:hypothetical protein